MALLAVLGAIGVLLLAIVVLLAFIALRPPGVTASSLATVTPTGTPSLTRTPAPASSSTPTATADDSVGATGQGSGSGSGEGGGTIGNNSSGDDQSNPTPTPTDTAQDVKKPLMQVFSMHTTVACVTGTDAVPAQLNFDITINWTARDVEGVYIGIDTSDAVANPFEGPLPASGSIVVPFSCYGPHTYSFAAVGFDGSRDEGAVNVVNTGDPDPNAN